jgi:hypothetical protein
MSLRHAVFGGRIARRTINRPKLSLSGYAALQLILHFGTFPLLEGVGAANHKQRESDRAKDRQAFHLLILGSGGRIAIALKR